MNADLNIFTQRLIQARKMARLSLRALAAQLGGAVSHTMLAKYEKGLVKPDSAFLIKLSEALGVPVDFFLSRNVISLENLHFRKKSSLSKSIEESLKEKARDFFSRYLEIEQITNDNIHCLNPLRNDICVSLDDAERLADKLRSEWELGCDPLPNLMQLLESKGIKIFEFSEEEAKIDGFCWEARQEDSLYLMAINQDNTDVPRKRFSIAHELGHLLLNMPQEIEPKFEEKLANKFASVFLMPAKTFMADFGRSRHKIAIKELAEIKRNWGVSYAASIYRAHDLDIISDSTKDSFYYFATGRGWKKMGAEPQDYLGTEKSTRFEQLVLKAAAEGDISLLKGASLLHVSLEEFREELRNII